MPTLVAQDNNGAAAMSDSAPPQQAENLIPVTLVRMEPLTGRRHQLRVHAALAGYPVVGDPTYSGSGGSQTQRQRKGASRLCLHSVRLEISFEDVGECLKVESPSPFQLLPNSNNNKRTLDVRMF